MDDGTVSRQTPARIPPTSLDWRVHAGLERLAELRELLVEAEGELRFALEATHVGASFAAARRIASIGSLMRDAADGAERP